MVNLACYILQHLFWRLLYHRFWPVVFIGSILVVSD
jgi:hypothetical protein